MSNFLPMLADRVLNRPLLLDPAKAETIFAVLEGRITLGTPTAQVAEIAAEIEGVVPEANRLTGSYRRDSRPAGLSRKVGNASVITIDGSLVNRGAWIGASSGLTSYEGLAAQITDAANDREISAIILDINSPGGEATGMFGLAATIRQARGVKPVVAYVNDVAASAAYGIASAADEIVVSPTSIVGSIGVVMLHLDRSKEVEDKGIKPTLIHSGAHKVDGHPFGPLSDDVRAALQADADTFYARFLETVEAGRGERTTALRARQTEARTFIGQAAIDAGLADRMATFEEIVASLQQPGQTGRPGSQGTARMDTVSKADHEAALATARTEARAEGARAERERVSAILNHEAATGRERAAIDMALDAETTFSATSAGKMLAHMPKHGAAEGGAGASTQTLPNLEQRSTGTEMGAGNSGDAVPEAAAGWASATAQINKRLG